jgi:hypothetical protein
MRFALTLALLAAACSGDGDRPVGPGGGVGGNGSGAVDGGGADALGQGTIEGRLCLVSDLRLHDQCPSLTGLGGIKIENAITGATTTSDDNGNFTLPAAQGNYTQIRVAYDDEAYRDVLVPIGLVDGRASGVQLPLVPALVWQDLIFVIGMNEPEATASLAAYFVRIDNLDASVAGVTITVPQGTAGVPVYDGPGGPFDFTPGGGTGQRGAAILLGIPTTDPKIDLVTTPFGQENFIAPGVALEPNVLTFITVALP